MAMFEARLSRIRSNGLLTLLVLAIVVSLTLFLMAFAVGGKVVGSPFIYLAALTVSSGLTAAVVRRDAAVIRVVHGDASSPARLVIRGAGVDIEEPVTATCAYWVRFERMPRKAGGGQLVVYHLLFQFEGDPSRRVGFLLRAGRPGSEPSDWPQRGEGLPEFSAPFPVFHFTRIRQFVATISPASNACEQLARTANA